MKLLTELKIRKLMKETDLKKCKRLEIQPDTIITPAARSFLNEHKIQLSTESETSVSVVQESTLPNVEEGHSTLFKVSQDRGSQLGIELDRSILDIILLQKDNLKHQTFVLELETLKQILKEVKLNLQNKESQTDLSKKRHEFYIGNSKFVKQYSDGTEPSYTDSTQSLQLFKIYLDLKSGVYKVINDQEMTLSSDCIHLIVWLLDFTVTLIEKYKNYVL